MVSLSFHLTVAQVAGNHGTINLKIHPAVIADYRWAMIASCSSIMIVAHGVAKEPLQQQILFALSAMH
jgi:hypothetical protein